MAFVLREEPSAKIEKETTPEKIKRHSLRSLTRIGETVAGIPGDIASTILGVGEVAKKIHPFAATGLRSEEELEKVKSFLPTSENIREKVIKPLTGEYLEPKTGGEQLSDDIISDATMLLTPFKGKLATKGVKAFKTAKYLQPIAKNVLAKIGVSAGSNLAGKGSEMAGAGPKTQFAIKLGSMMALGLIGKGRGGPKAVKDKSYAMVKESIKGNPRTSVKEFSNTLNELSGEFTTLGLKKAPSKKKLIEQIKEIYPKIKNGKMRVRDLWETKIDLNEIAKEFYKETKDPETLKRGRMYFQKLNKGIKKDLTQYGEKNTAFGKNFKEAETAHAALAQSQKLGKFMINNLKGKMGGPLTYSILHSLGVGTKSVAKVATAGLAYKGFQIGYRMVKSPLLRKHYMGMLKAAATQNVWALNKNYSKLKHDLDKEKEKETDKSSGGRFVLRD